MAVYLDCSCEMPLSSIVWTKEYWSGLPFPLHKDVKYKNKFKRLRIKVPIILKISEKYNIVAIYEEMLNILFKTSEVPLSEDKYISVLYNYIT